MIEKIDIENIERLVNHWIESSDRDFKTMQNLYQSKDWVHSEKYQILYWNNAIDWLSIAPAFRPGIMKMFDIEGFSHIIFVINYFSE